MIAIAKQMQIEGVARGAGEIDVDLFAGGGGWSTGFVMRRRRRQEARA